MKLFLVPAIVLLSLPAAAVRMESDGVRVGDEVVTGKVIGLKSAGDLPVLVSGSAVENLSSTGKALEVAIGDKKILLDVGIRLDRAAEGYRLSTHGPAFAVDAGGAAITLEQGGLFTVTEKGFDFGKAGSLEGGTLTTKISAKGAQEPGAQPEPPMPLPSRARPNATRPKDVLRRIFTEGDVTIYSQAADGHTIQSLVHVSPAGSP